MSKLFILLGEEPEQSRLLEHRRPNTCWRFSFQVSPKNCQKTWGKTCQLFTNIKRWFIVFCLIVFWKCSDVKHCSYIFCKGKKSKSWLNEVRNLFHNLNKYLRNSHQLCLSGFQPCPASRLSMDHHLKELVLPPRATATTPQENTAATS